MIRFALIPALLLCCACDGVPVASAGEAAAVEEAPKMAELGKPAPDFSLTDTDGNTVKLSQFAGKTVVIEWFNPGCPFVKYAHGDKGPLATLPQRWIDKGVVWLAVNSGAEGKQGHGLEKNREARAKWGMSYPVLLDESGDVGRMYGAKTTPHMYVVDGTGKLVYRGALDNAPFGDVKGEKPVDFLSDCLNAVTAGNAPAVTETKSYGCSVKY